MSLRDDLLEVSRGERNADRAFERLFATLTPAAEVWLAALPALMEMESELDPGPWNVDHELPWRILDDNRLPLGDAYRRQDRECIVLLRNTLAAAKAAGEKETK